MEFNRCPECDISQTLVRYLAKVQPSSKRLYLAMITETFTPIQNLDLVVLFCYQNTQRETWKWAKDLLPSKLQGPRLKDIIRLRSCLRFISVDVTCLGFISLDVTCPRFMLFVTRPPSTTSYYPDYWDLYSGFQSATLGKNKTTNLHGM